MYYVINEANCKFEGMTKEEIYDAIAEATGVTPTPIDEAFITKIKEQNQNQNTKIWTGTTAQYNALTVKDPHTLYFLDSNKIKPGEADYPITIDKGGTGATTKSGAITNLELTGAETKTLLWENASPSSSFSPQTISLGLTNYRFVEIEFAWNQSTNYGYKYERFVKKNHNYAEACFEDTNNNPVSITRRVDVSNTNLVFKEGRWVWPAGYVTENLAMRPLKIYGIKEVS